MRPRHPSKGGNANGSKWIWPRTRRRIYARDRHRCVWCTKDLSRSSKARRTLDHVRPRVWYGVTRTHNHATIRLRIEDVPAALFAMLMKATASADVL